MPRNKQDWSPRTPNRSGDLNAQPEWEFIANMGDKHPLDHGGYFIYEDATGVYEAEAALITPDEKGKKCEVLRINLERYKLVDGYLVPIRYDSTWPRPLKDYDVWFHRDLAGAADSIGATAIELEVGFTSVNPLVRAEAYRVMGDYHGWANFDAYPLILTMAEMKKKYRKELKQIAEER